MNTPVTTRQPVATRNAGFGLVDAMVALSLLAVTLFGACASMHFALRATRSAAWQARAVDLVADLNEDLQQTDPALPLDARLDAWRLRLQQALPAAHLDSIEPRTLASGDTGIDWIDLRLVWNGIPGQQRDALRLPVAHAVPEP